MWNSGIQEWIRVTGEDAEDYLQSQFSQDIRQLKSGETTYGLLLSLKGKVRADGFIYKIKEEVYGVVSYFCSIPEVIEILEENVIADDVEFERVPTGGSFITLQKPPQGDYPGALIFSGRRMQEGHWDVILPQGSALPESLSTVEELEQIRIQDGIVAVPADIGSDNLPQEGGLEDVAVSFNKGCFLGQEVMARLKAMGQVQKKIYVVKGSGEVPSSGTDIYCGEKSAGDLRSVCESEEESIWQGLALLRWRFVEDRNAADFKLANGSGLEIVKAGQ